MSLAKVIYIYLPTKRNKERLTHITFIINIDTANEKYNKKNNFFTKRMGRVRRHSMNQSDIVIKEAQRRE